MKKQSDLLLSEERKLITKLGFLIGIEVELWKLPPPQPSEFPPRMEVKVNCLQSRKSFWIGAN